MSDHWKLLANILGTPGPAEPAAKEPTKKKPDVSSGENKSNVDHAGGSSARRDPLAEIVVRHPDPVVPGFDVPAPPPVTEKPAAKRSAWDTLIGTLGIKTASDPEPVASEPAQNAPARTSSVRPTVAREPVAKGDFAGEAAPVSRQFGGDLGAPAQGGEERSAKRGFGAGLVDSGDRTSEPSPETAVEPDYSPARGSSFRDSEPRQFDEERPSRDSRPETRTSRSQPQEPRSSETRQREPRPSEPRRRDEPRQSDSRTRDSRPNETRSPAPSRDRDDVKKDSLPKARGFGDGIGDNDGILDWDVDQDDVYLRDDDLIDDDVELDLDAPVSEVARPTASPRERDDADRPRGRGRRGGSRNRGRGDSRSEETAETVSDDVIGWKNEVTEEDSERARVQSPRSDAGRGDSARELGPRRDDGRENPRGGRGREPRRDSSPRDEARREPSPAREGQRREPARDEVRREPIRDEARRDAPAGELPRRQERPEGSTPAEGGRRSGRRGQRQQMSSESVNPRVSREDTPRLPDADLDYDDLMHEELPAPSTGAPSDSGDGPTRPRRRRGRRGRGGSASTSTTSDRDAGERTNPVEEIGFADVGFASELSPDAIDSVELNDDLEDDVEAERVRRGRRRGRGRGEPRERTESAGEVDSMPQDGSVPEESVSVSKNRGIPTWLDTVSLLVEPNIERHRRTGPARPPQGRGGRR
jgi:hypothetical protein